MVTAPFKIQPGREYVSRYRYLVTSTVADMDFINKRWHEYAQSESQRVSNGGPKTNTQNDQ